MNAPIYYVGGCKGGVGKSHFSFALLDYLLERQTGVLLLETDTANPDVWKAHQPYETDALVCKLANLDEAEGWIELVNFCEEHPGHIAVINSAARSNEGMERYGEMLRETLGELQRNLTAFWLINRQRDSLELLRAFHEMFPENPVHVCRNLYFGDVEKFEMYNESKIRQAVEEKGLTLDFPKLANRVADKMNAAREPIQTILPKLPLGDRVELKRWRSVCVKMFDQALGERP